LKDYKRYVLWIDYFNSALSRSDGRRVPLDRSVKDPRLDELAEAVRSRLAHASSGSADHVVLGESM